MIKKEIYYNGTPSCQRCGSSKRIFDDFTGQYCDWHEEITIHKTDMISVIKMPIEEVYKTIVDNNLIEKLSAKGKTNFYEYERTY